ncbi:hypothetical protein OH76DRAFT_1487641 [Lentinus brumalis]|uniref:Uncharacterized protein n=1 Tax=Lentinus brumalis TaxID=2498619 RepID=A0A371CTX1_9APHY|nr:hypothetical protein OH76DRAFT_1487641 [Polyporus brumalis]
MASSTHAAPDVGHDNESSLNVVAHSAHPSMHHVYKGKTARLITTYYLLDTSANGYCPNAWEPRELWPQRFAFTTLRDALEIERVMHLFPAWKCHLENHLFWNKACALLDPMGSLNHHLTVVHPTAGSQAATAVRRISMYRHYRSMLDVSCAVCRVNYPYHAEGLCAGSAKRTVNTPTLGVISLCKEHRKTAAFCGVCLREAPRTEFEDDYSQGPGLACAENEDEETWPGVDATCRACRSEVFWRRVNLRREWQEAVDGRRWATVDWETKQSVESFIDMGEGSIRDVLQIAEDKHWLRKFTKLGDMLQQALAASRYASRAEAGEAYASDEELSDEDMDDPEMLGLTEDAGGIKELALNDWARNRILDGHWITPADEYFGYTNQGRPRLAPAVHPCPWNRRSVYEGALDDGQGDEAQELQHPRPKTLVPHPPSFGLCEQTYRVFQRQLREILLPPMRNLVRKLVMESAADGTDPAIRAVRMTLEDVLCELRDESTWYNGIDWLERRANTRLEAERRHAKDDDSSSSSSSSSSRSDGSHTTSPVLSTTTLQTTPSPPPSGKDDEIPVSSPLVGAPGPTSPVMKAPELLRPIPYVPITTKHLPQHSVEALVTVWREACAPLYQCQCSICERAMLNANMASGTVPTQAQLAVPQVQPQPQVPQVQIKIQEAPIRIDDGEVEEDDDLDESEEESEDGESERGDDTPISIPESPAPAFQVTPRKRPSSDLDAEAESDAFSFSTSTTDADADQSERSERSRTPPKRMRREGSFDQSQASPVATAPPPSSSPLRQRKRSSEELEDDSGVSPIAGKRPRAEAFDRPPPSTLASTHATPVASPGKTAVVAGAPAN